MSNMSGVSNKCKALGEESEREAEEIKSSTNPISVVFFFLRKQERYTK